MATHIDQKTDEQKHVWDLIEKVRFCMFTTRHGEMMHARPMAAYVDKQDGYIYFLTDNTGDKIDEIEQHDDVCLCFADTGSQKYVCVMGKAQVQNDRAKIHDLWGTPAKAWWNDPEDPTIRVIKVAPQSAEYWDGPGKLGSLFKMALAAVSDHRPDMGETGHVNLA